MTAPLTGNSITERVLFTGLYVAEPTWSAADTAAEEPESSDWPEPDEEAL